MKKIVIIPSAKIVPENMRDFGAIPTILYPLNSKTMIDVLCHDYEKRALSDFEGGGTNLL